MKTKIMQQENPKGNGVQQHLERPGTDKTFCGRKYDNGHWHHYHDFNSDEDEVDDHVSCTLCRAGAKKFMKEDPVEMAVDKIKRASRTRKKESKTCKECGLDLPLDEFYVKKNVVNGKTYEQVQSRCKECNRKVCRRYARSRKAVFLRREQIMGKAADLVDFIEQNERTKCFQRAVEFIALNDEPGDLDVNSVKQNLSVVAVAEALQVTELKLATAIVKLRKGDK